MRLNIVNLEASNVIDSNYFIKVVSAVSRQVSEDFSPEWSVDAVLRPSQLDLQKNQAPIDGIGDAVIYIGASSQDPTTGVGSVYGYHYTNHAELAYGFVYLDVCALYSQDWATVLSHEVLELLADPTAALTVAGKSPDGASATFPLEVCDATMGDTYPIDGVTVSNFVNRKYFGLPGKSSVTNFLGLPLDPFGVRPLGYLHYFDAAGSSVDKWGAEIDREKFKEGRERLQLVRRNARRDARRKAVSSKDSKKV
jgi:hypothetical protein